MIEVGAPLERSESPMKRTNPMEFHPLSGRAGSLRSGATRDFKRDLCRVHRNCGVNRGFSEDDQP